jgi:hypothetical protein
VGTAGGPPAAIRFTNGVLVALNVLVIVAFTLWDVWATWVAFFGGALPVPGGHLVTGGSLLLGALFVFVVSPLLFGLARLVTVGLSGLILGIVAHPAVAPATPRAVRPTNSSGHSAVVGTDTITVRFRDGSVIFARDGTTAQIRATGFGGVPSPEIIHAAKEAARERLQSQGRTPWF